MITEARIAELRALADVASSGPWEATISDHGHSVTGAECGVVTEDVGDIVCDLMSVNRLAVNERYRNEGQADAFFIAAARTAVPELLDELTRLAAENTALRRRLVEAGATDPGEEWARDE